MSRHYHSLIEERRRNTQTFGLSGCAATDDNVAEVRFGEGLSMRGLGARVPRGASPTGVGAPPKVEATGAGRSSDLMSCSNRGDRWHHDHAKGLVLQIIAFVFFRGHDSEGSICPSERAVPSKT